MGAHSWLTMRTKCNQVESQGLLFSLRRLLGFKLETSLVCDSHHPPHSKQPSSVLWHITLIHAAAAADRLTYRHKKPTTPRRAPQFENLKGQEGQITKFVHNKPPNRWAPKINNGIIKHGVLFIQRLTSSYHPHQEQIKI